MDLNNNNQQPEQTPPPAAPGATPPPTTTPGQTPSVSPQAQGTGSNATVVNNQGEGGGKDKKKMIVVGLLLVIVLMILAVIGYYAYSVMSAGSVEQEPQATITQEPTPSPEPTVPPNPIQGEDDLDQVLDEIDSATEEAEMTEEVQGLRTDSNF